MSPTSRSTSASRHVLGASSLAFAMLGAAAPALAEDASTDGGKEVVVTAQRAVTTPKQTVPLRDTPKSITVIPQELIQSTGSASLVDALRTVPGITFGAGEGGNPVGDRPFLRGYDAQSATFVDGLRDIGSQSREVFNIDSVEVVKGASGSYAGRGGAGGGIYINNKAPTRTSFTTASFGVGSADYGRATFDTNHAFGDSGYAVRLNAMVHDAGVAGRDEVHASRWGIAPSFALGLGTHDRIVLSYYHLQSDDMPDSGIPYSNPAFVARTDGRPRTLQTGDGSPVKVDRNTFYGMVNRDFRKERVDMGSVRFEHDFSRSLHLRNTLRTAASTQDYIWSQPDDSKGNIYYGLVFRRPLNRVSTVRYLVNQTDFYGTFTTGKVVHNFATGLELSKETGENDSYNVTFGGVAALTFGTNCSAAAIAAYLCTTLENPNANDPSTGVISRALNPTNAETVTKALYAFDTIEFNDHWQANLGIRYDDYKATFVSARAATTPFARTTFVRKDTLVNYQAGIVYKPGKMSAVYVSYATTSTPAGNSLAQGVDSNALSSTVNANLKPEKNATLEAGVKWDVLEGRLSLTGAVFDAETSNARITQADGSIAMAGEKRVRGFEVGVSGDLTDKWQVFGGYTFLDAILVKNGGAGAAAGLTDGQPFPNTARNSASLWTTYKLGDRLTVGGGATYVDKIMGSTNPTLPKFIPSYTRLDVTASYRINDRLDLQLNVQNVTDEVYFSQAYTNHYATIAPGRSVVLTLNTKL
jgi:catecholate siderophore receptor